MKDRKLAAHVVWLLITLLAAAAWTEFYLSQRNIIGLKKGWTLGTLEFLNPEIVSVPAYTSLLPLRGFRLQSDTDLGIIRILSEKDLGPEEVGLIFRLKEDGFVDIISGYQQGRYQAVRLSTNPLTPSSAIASTEEEKYLSVKELPRITPGFHVATLRKGSLDLDGSSIAIPGFMPSSGKVGTQVSPGNAEVFAMKVKTNESTQLLHFFPDGPRASLILRHSAILIVVVLIIGLIPGLDRKRVAGFFAGAGALALLWNAVIGVDVPERPQDLRERFELLDRWWAPENETLAERIRKLKKDDSDSVIFLCKKDGCEKNLLSTRLPPKTGERFLIFGGSQSKYALIRNFSESFHFRFDAALRKRKPEIETINVSTPGLFVDRVRAYGGSLDNIQADTLILEVLAPEIDHSSIREFLARMKGKVKRIIVLRTPQNLLNFRSPEVPALIYQLNQGLALTTPPASLDKKWTALRNAAFFREAQKDFGITFLDPNIIFADPGLYKKGQIFWDATHLTIYGQELLADWLAREIAKLN